MMASITFLRSETVGASCAVSREVASRWADRFLDLPRTAWSDPRSGNYVRGTAVCLSSLLAAGRHHELLGVLTLQRFPFWHDRQFGMQALLSEGRTKEALAYAEASRGLNQPDAAIDAACEKILLNLGRVDEAYEKYALTANASSTGLATFRAIVKKYPHHDPKKILWTWPARAATPAGGLPRRKTPASSISPWNLPMPAPPIRERSAAHRVTSSRRTYGSVWR